jgi:ribosomal protein S18 acetylase RimI-like enzyme
MSDTVTTLPGQQTMLACWRALALLSPAASVFASGGAVAAVFPAWEPLNNAVLLTAVDGPAATVAADQLAAAYLDAGVASWALWLPSPVTDLDTPDEVVAVDGLERDTTTLVMQAAIPAPLRLHGNVLRTTVATAAIAGDTPLPAADLPAPDRLPGLDAWVLVHAGFAVAGAWTYLYGTELGIYAVGTAPQLRRRGFARTLMEHLLSDAYERGARTATLQSSHLGQPLYRSLGFEPVGRYEEWVFRFCDIEESSCASS